MKRKGEKLEQKQAKKAQNDGSALDSAQAPGGSIALGDEGQEMEVEDQNVGGSDEPNKTLFVEQLPAEVNETMLKMLFQQFRNFNEVSRGHQPTHTHLLFRSALSVAL